MKKMDELLKQMQAQKECYAKLFELAVGLCEKLDSDADISQLIELMAGREKLIEDIKELDESVERLLSGPGGEGLMETEEARSLQSEMATFVIKTVDMDKTLMERIENAKGSVLSELGAMGKGRKTIAGYGKISSPVYARFIDFKHK